MHEIISSKTDPDAGYMNRLGKSVGFHYLSHTSLDAPKGLLLMYT